MPCSVCVCLSKTNYRRPVRRARAYIRDDQRYYYHGTGFLACECVCVVLTPSLCVCIVLYTHTHTRTAICVYRCTCTRACFRIVYYIFFILRLRVSSSYVCTICIIRCTSQYNIIIISSLDYGSRCSILPAHAHVPVILVCRSPSCSQSCSLLGTPFPGTRPSSVGRNRCPAAPDTCASLARCTVKKCKSFHHLRKKNYLHLNAYI